MMLCRPRWNISDYNQLILKLKSLADPKYKAFLQRLIPGAQNVLGVRMPFLRKMAKDIAKGNFAEFLSVAKDTYHETVLLKGLVICYCKAPIQQLMEFCKRFVPQIDNWAVCDTFATNLKIAKQDKGKFLEFVLWFLSGTEFEKRFALVVLLSKYLTEKNLNLIFDVCSRTEGGYYVKMAVAWLLSYCFIKFPDRTAQFLKNCPLDVWTYNKTLQKITESKQVDEQTKQRIRDLRRLG